MTRPTPPAELFAKAAQERAASAALVADMVLPRHFPAADFVSTDRNRRSLDVAVAVERFDECDIAHQLFGDAIRPLLTVLQTSVDPLPQYCWKDDAHPGADLALGLFANYWPARLCTGHALTVPCCPARCVDSACSRLLPVH